MKKNKIMRCYRINPIVYEELIEIIEEIGAKETTFVEISIIEKIARIKGERFYNDKNIKETLKVSENG